MMSSQAAAVMPASLSCGARRGLLISHATLSRARSTASESKKRREESLNFAAPMRSEGAMTVSGWYFGPMHAAITNVIPSEASGYPRKRVLLRFAGRDCERPLVSAAEVRRGITRAPLRRALESHARYFSRPVLPSFDGPRQDH